MNFLSNKIQNNKVLLSNIGSLSVVQLINYLIPLITLPYVVRVLGPENFGVASFFIAFINYLTLITDYGFNFSGVRDVSINRNNPEKLSQIFSSIFYTKVFLFLISVILLSIFVLNFQLLNKNISIIIILLLNVAGNLFYPQWFYQGLENTKALPLINLIPKSLGVISIFIFVKSSSDLYLYIFIISIVNFVLSVAAFLYSFSLTELKLLNFDFNEIVQQLKNSWKLFLSSISMNFYTTTNVVILGLLTNESAVGIYSAADKIRLAMQGLFAPISQSVFPKVNYLALQSVNSFINFNKKLLSVQSTFAFLISLLVFIFSPQLVELILGPQYQGSVNVLKILCWLPFIISISNVYGIQILLALKEDKKFLQVVFSASLISVISVLILTSLYNEIGTAITFLITEIYVSSLMYIFYKRILKKNEV